MTPLYYKKGEKRWQFFSTILGIIKMSIFWQFLQSCNFHRQTNFVSIVTTIHFISTDVKQKKNHNAWNQWCICISQKPLYRTNAISISIFPRSTCNLLKCINPLLKLGKKELKIFDTKLKFDPTLKEFCGSTVAPNEKLHIYVSFGNLLICTKLPADLW